MAQEALIKPADIKEQVLGKIADLRVKNLTAKQKEEVDLNEKIMASCFKRLCWGYFGISKDQILQWTDEECGELFNIVLKRAKRTSFFLKLFCWVVPVPGWALAAAIFSDPYSGSGTYYLCKSTRQLKQALGNGFNPVSVLRDKLSASHD